MNFLLSKWCALAIAFAGAGGNAAQVKTTPEAAMGNIVLTAQSEQRLGVTTAPVETKAMPRWRNYPAEVVLPPGQTSRLTAAIPGTVHAPRDGWLSAGVRVKRGQVVVGVQAVLLEPDRLRAAEVQLNIATARAQAEGEVRRAEGALQLARQNVTRGKDLLAAEAGSARALQEAKAALVGAEAASAAAQERKDVFDKLAFTPSAETPVTWMAAPIDGIVRDVQALPGQQVAPGAILLEIIDLEHLWARVPVSVDELAAVRRGAGRVALDALAKREEWIDVKQVPAPPTAAAVSASVDLYFALDNRDAAWAPGMRAVAALPLKGEAESLVVPWSAVVHDPTGGSWVYAWTAPHTFGRRRVLVDRIEGERAVLSAGPPAGTPVAVAGVAELFGLDVGYAK